MHRSRVLGPAIALAAILLTADAARAETAPIFTTIAVEPLAAPRPFRGADGQTHLAYELSLVNMTRLVTRIDAVAAVAEGKVVGEWSGDRLASLFRINGGDTGVVLGPSQSALLFLDVAIPQGESVPTRLAHRISTTRMIRAPGDDIHTGKPLDASIPLPASVTFTTRPFAIDDRPVIRLSPPLRGDRWIVANGCCSSITSHRGAVMAFDGSVFVPERFAIDFIELGADDRLVAGPPDQVTSYRYFGTTVYAAAAGTVTSTSDGAPEETPGAPRSGITPENAAGNHIVVDMGEGNFALYAHLQPGSLLVKAGQHVARGEPLAKLGNTGNSDAPHLHFHVMDGPIPLTASGLPFAFDRFVGEGHVTIGDAEIGGAAVPIDKAWNAGARQDALPLDGELIGFEP